MLCLVLMACSDELYMQVQGDAADGQAMRFEATVIEQPLTRGQVMDVDDNYITRDFKAGDSFGLFIVDANGNLVSLIGGKNARNIRLTTPDGKAWNLNSDITEVVHKMGYRYVAYYPYAESFGNCSSLADIQSRLTPPATDQSTQEATDWMYTEATSPQTNAVTTLYFRHRYAKIDIYHSFTQDHRGDWTAAYPYTKTIDENQVEHYRYLLDLESPQTLSISGTYTIGNSLTGIKEFAYNCNDIILQNGRHAIVYTYRMDERCAVDLGLPSGIRWSPINLGTESGTYMGEAELAAVGNALGKRLAWGELFEKDTYNYDSYINDPYIENGASVLPSDITETVYDPVRQYWGGHWALPSADDMKEFIDNTEVVNTEAVYSDELGKDINRITFRSKINGKEITMLTNGYTNGSIVSGNAYLYYMSANLSGYAYSIVMTNNSTLRTANNYRYLGYCIRPVLKERYTYSDADKEGIIPRHIDNLAVDLGITKTVTETIDGVPQDVTYKLLWSPFNYGAEAKVALQTYNQTPINEEAFVSKCMDSQGIRLAWGDLEERATFSYPDYMASPIITKYAFNNTTGDLSARHLLPEDDIVQQNWPDGWYIPTAQDLELLYKNTTITTVSSNGHTWVKLTGKNGYEGNSILVPCTGYIDNKPNTELWSSGAYLMSSTIGTKGNNYSIPYTTYVLQLNRSGGQMLSTAGRPTGFMLRPVKYVRAD